MPPPAGSKSSLVAVGAAVVVGGLLVPRLLTTSPEPTTPEAPSLAGPLLKLAVGLVVTAAAVVALARFTNRKAISTPSNGTVTSSLTLANRCVLHLVEMNGRRLLVGVDLGGVKAMAELPPNAVGPLPASVPAGFADELAAVLNARAAGSPPAAG